MSKFVSVQFLSTNVGLPAIMHSSKSLELDYQQCQASILFTCFQHRLFNTGIKKIIDFLEKRPDLREKVEAFYRSSSNLDEILKSNKYCTIFFMDPPLKKFNSLATVIGLKDGI